MCFEAIFLNWHFRSQFDEICKRRERKLTTMCYSRSNNKKYHKTGCRGKESAGKESAGEETTTPGGFLRRRCQRRREKAAHPNPPTATTTRPCRNNPSLLATTYRWTRTRSRRTMRRREQKVPILRYVYDG